MTIVEVDTVRVRSTLRRPFVTAVRRTDRVDSVVVRVRDADGRVGWGEACDNPRVTGETSDGIEAVVRGPLRDAVLGRDALDLTPTCHAIAAAVHANASARSAVDCAVHDLAARTLGVPLRVLLGGRRAELRTDVTLSAAAADELADDARARVAEGFDVLKVKLDGHDDVDRLRSVLAAAGPGVRLRVDANQAWTPRQAVRVIGAIEDAGLPVDLVEQPVAGADLDGLAFVTARVATPVLADESVHTAADVVEIARRRSADLVNLKLAKCGGLSAAREFLAVAAACGLGVVVGSMLETHIGCGAAANLAAAAGPGCDPVVDLDPPWLLRDAPVMGGMRIVGPAITLPDAPGSGIEVLTAP